MRVWADRRSQPDVRHALQTAPIGPARRRDDLDVEPTLVRRASAANEAIVRVVPHDFDQTRENTPPGVVQASASLSPHATERRRSTVRGSQRAHDGDRRRATSSRRSWRRAP